MIYVNRQVVAFKTKGGYVLVTGVPPYTITHSRTKLYSGSFNRQEVRSVETKRSSKYTLTVRH